MSEWNICTLSNFFHKYRWFLHFSVNLSIQGMSLSSKNYHTYRATSVATLCLMQACQMWIPHKGAGETSKLTDKAWEGTMPIKGSKCSSTFLQPSPGSPLQVSAMSHKVTCQGGLSCCLWRAHVWGSKQSSHPLMCAQISAVILIKAACVNQRFWEMHLMGHCRDPVDLQVIKRSLCWLRAGRFCGV